jgi:hypothetical protein
MFSSKLKREKGQGNNEMHTFSAQANSHFPEICKAVALKT